MFFQPENAPIVKTNAFKNSVAIKQTMIEDGNFRVCFRHKFSVDEKSSNAWRAVAGLDSFAGLTAQSFAVALRI